MTVPTEVTIPGLHAIKSFRSSGNSKKGLANVNVIKKPPITPPVPLTPFAAVNKAKK